MTDLASVALSPHFRLGEFRCAGGAKESAPCACHGAYSVDMRLVSALEAVRAEVIGGATMVLSGFRCDPYNQHVGGHPQSYHRLGMAADILYAEPDIKDAAEAIGLILREQLIERGQVIYYPHRNFIHLDVGMMNPHKGRVRCNESKPKSRGY